MQEFNRNKLKIKPLAERFSKLNTSIIISPSSEPPQISQEALLQLKDIAACMQKARRLNSPIIVVCGAHLVKNGLSKILIELMNKKYIQHILSNGAFSIHDWEFSY